jgi:hypothetical protein
MLTKIPYYSFYKSTRHPFYKKPPYNFFKDNLSCDNCKYKETINDESVCKLFQYSTLLIEDKPIMDFYIDTATARNSEQFCGVQGRYFKPK